MKAIIDAIEFKRIIDGTKKFTSTYGADKMQYIHLRFENGEVRAAALDGHRASVEYASYRGDNFKCYVKTTIPQLKGVNSVVVELTGDRALVIADDDIIGCKQPEGEFYPVDNLIAEELEKENIGVVGVNPTYLIDALKSICGITTKDKMAKIEIRSKTEPLIIRSGEKNVKLILPMRIDG